MGGPLVPLSKDSAEFWLSGSELALVVLAVVVIVGLIGEYAEDRRAKKWIPDPYPHRWHWSAIWEWVVIVGILGELFSDGGIWVSSDALQAISDREVGGLRCENLALEKALASRRLEPGRSMNRGAMYASEGAFKQSMKAFSGSVVKLQTAPEFEAATLSADLADLLKKSGWTVVSVTEQDSHFLATDMREGITLLTSQRNVIEVENAAIALQGALKAALPDSPESGIWRSKIRAHLGQPSPDFSGDGKDPDANDGFVYVSVGPRPITAVLQDIKLHPPTPPCN